MRKADNALSRRNMIRGGATALVAGAVINGATIAMTKEAPAAFASSPSLAGLDPIFAAIDRHKVTFHASQAAGNIQMCTVDAEWSPLYDAVKCKAAYEASIAADNADEAAANALTTIQPTTIAGLLALMLHVEKFNAGAFALDIDPDWRSGAMHWPTDLDEDHFDVFGYTVLANVRRALAAMAVQS